METIEIRIASSFGAGAAVALFVVASMGASAAEYLTADEVRARLVGKEYRGTGYTERYHEDGTTSGIWFDKNPVRGKWEITEEGALCLDYDWAEAQYGGCWYIEAGPSPQEIFYHQGRNKTAGTLVE